MIYKAEPKGGNCLRDVDNGRDGWPELTHSAGQVDLQVEAAVAGEDDPIQDLSAAVLVDGTLFLGSDEGTSIERLGQIENGWKSSGRLQLADCLPIDPDQEADIEGLAEDDGWLWVLGSHAKTRPKLKKRDDARIDLQTYADLRNAGARCLLARLPLVPDDQASGLLKPVGRTDARRAQMLKQTKQTKHGNALARALARDPLMAPFTKIPAKEGGVDLEGIAVAFPRVALGMRGPVIEKYAVLLEFELRERAKTQLAIDGSLYKRMLDLEGLGIRDLKRVGKDLLILAGPTTALDGPCAVYRWRGWLDEPPAHKHTVCLHRPERIIELGFGRGNDHPEALAVVHDQDIRKLLVICDSPSDKRLDLERRTITCELFQLD
ncbi:DUF3616 domain-containing protein [Sphingomonas xinjiangensis]|uniref:DUF3616 domain-containing protein n=1 Tax=Sphingomonas xinjiangensis TaxID=643568 RepID=A0A840YTE1_9SPHN|nr:DUF3616 domain-containing protein [Sphingomonas xinjiangensis]MBB5712893.1 hypothetical protein [Sphingomonas xinjiangensis]